MPWLVSDGHVLASAQVATTRRMRAVGLLGRDCVDGALVLPRTRSIHTLRMRFPIDVAWCDASMTVLRTERVAPNRITLPVWQSRWVIEAEAGMFARWELVPGVELELRE
jgi:uncharacterized membrane protein (UPF0127 family)